MNSPFLNFPSLDLESRATRNTPIAENIPESPFLAAPKLNGSFNVEDPKAEMFVRMLDELYDEELEESMQDLLQEASELYASPLRNNMNFNQEVQFAHLIQDNYVQLFQEIDGLFAKLILDSEQIDNGQKTLEELGVFLDEYQPKIRGISPIQENFLKKIRNKIKNVTAAVKKGVQKVGGLASKLGVRFLMNKLKKIVKQFLYDFLEKGIQMLPEKYRGLATNLAKKILPKQLTENATAAIPGKNSSEAGADPAETSQQEMNVAIAHLLTASNEREWEMIEREIDQIGQESVDMAHYLNEARNDFIGKTAELQEGESPEPQVEQFVTAITTALKFVIPVIGRERVKGWLVSLITKLIEKLVGKENATALAGQMVEAGLKMLNLEIAEAPRATLGTSAVAATVEETIRQLEHFPPYVFEDRQLFERHVIKAYEQAAAANLPDILSQRVYQSHPNLRESNRNKFFWNHTNGIKKLNRVVETELTPFIAQEVRSFQGIPLHTFLRDRMGLVISGSVPVKVHMLEALPGTNLFHLGRYASDLPGMSAVGRSGWTQFHPLTSIAAGLLLGEPGIGCKHPHSCLQYHQSAAGHRFYYLEIPGVRPQWFQHLDGRQELRRISGLKTKLDFLEPSIRLNLYLSESEAQAIAVLLRKKQAEAAHVLLTTALNEGLDNAFKYGKSNCLKLVHPNVVPGKQSGTSIEMVPIALVNAFREGLKNWVGQAAIRFLREQPEQLIAAAEDYSDGLTCNIRISALPGFDLLAQALKGTLTTVPETPFLQPPAAVLFTSKPGYHYD